MLDFQSTRNNQYTKSNCCEKRLEGAFQTSLERSRSLTLGNVKKAASRYETFLSSNEIDNEEHDVLFQDLFIIYLFI